MTADGRRPVAGHEPDHDAAEDGNGDHPRAEVIVRRRGELGCEAAVEGDIGDQSDETGQRLGDEARGDGDENREGADEYHPRIDERPLRRNPGGLQRGSERGCHGKRVGRRSLDDVFYRHVARL